MSIITGKILCKEKKLDKHLFFMYISCIVKEYDLTDKELLNYYMDFYGELLTKKQKEITLLYLGEDLSFTEIAEISGYSRQNAYDTVSKSIAKLKGYEEKLGLHEKFLKHNEDLKKIYSVLQSELKDRPEKLDTILNEMKELIY